MCTGGWYSGGLIAKGIGNTGADALYDLLSELYVIPISENLFLRVLSFIRLTFFSRIPYSVTKRIFSKDKRSDSEKKVIAAGKPGGSLNGGNHQMHRSKRADLLRQMKTYWTSCITMITPPAITLPILYAFSPSAVR